MRVIAGKFGGRSVLVPKGLPLRPTQEKVRGAIFSMLADLVLDARVLDLFAGTGALGLEALSRGAAFATFVESDRRAASAIRDNLQTFGARDLAAVHGRDAFAFLHGPPEPYDLIFADPPYEKNPRQPPVAPPERLFPAVAPWLRGVFVFEFARDAQPTSWAPFTLLKVKQYGDTGVALLCPLNTEAQAESVEEQAPA